MLMSDASKHFVTGSLCEAIIRFNMPWEEARLSDDHTSHAFLNLRNACRLQRTSRWWSHVPFSMIRDPKCERAQTHGENGTHKLPLIKSMPNWLIVEDAPWQAFLVRRKCAKNDCNATTHYQHKSHAARTYTGCSEYNMLLALRCHECNVFSPTEIQAESGKHSYTLHQT